MNTDIYNKATKILKDIYGHKAKFRKGQYEAIEAALTHHRTLIVQKTGWGKSLIYFISAKLVTGLTLIISPLIILMENQQKYAHKLGLKCLILSSRVKDASKEVLYDKLEKGLCDVLITTPESLFGKEMQRILHNLDIGMFVVDECHCISDWGHDFRLEYSRLNHIIANLPLHVPALGTTATANDRVINDLEKQFGENVFIMRGPLLRSSLHIQVLKLESEAERYAWIVKNINKLPGSGIIYCLTRRDCQRLADFLNENNILCRAYYSSDELEKPDNNGISPNQESEKLFGENKIKVIVATVKLGMGYDKPDIGFVIHFQCPSSLVAYYQQIGRAGRKPGTEAYCFLMAGKEDESIHEYFIENAFPTYEEEIQVVETLDKHSDAGLSLKGLTRYCNLNSRALSRSVMFLTNQNVICYKYGKYYRTLEPYIYQGDYYKSVRKAKKQEIKEILRFVKTKSCYGRYIANALNDYTAKDCGKCANCLENDVLHGLESPAEDEIALVQQRLNNMYIKITPRKYWPEIDSMFDSTELIGVPNETGIALCKYGDPGYGEMIAYDKYKANTFRDVLVEQSALAIAGNIGGKGYQTITNIPSSRSNKVADFAKRLAVMLGCRYMELFETTGSGKEQKRMLNTIHQYRNAKAKIKLKAKAIAPEKIILVDDMVDSKWTLTVAGRLLTLNGCKSVYPFCLADSSQTEVRL
ncbi:MAG: RecQ family ATP-dependent DNA helicase [Selenomonadaceae bacterium]|nr:RecQ family ATP-dependent DNA helicase [Selenomonadaceae bacterium]